MKITFHYKAVFAAVALTLGLLSCVKNNDDYNQPDVSGLSLINAVPNTEKLDVYINNSKATATDFAFGTKQDYLNVYSGTRTISVTKQGNGTKLKTEDFILKPRVGYSLFVLEKLEDPKFLFLEDELSRPTAGNGKVRFVNASEDAGQLTFIVEGQATDFFPTKPYMGYTDFKTVPSANVASFFVKDSNGLIVGSLKNVKIENQKIYTIYAKGLIANSSELTRFALSLFTHQ